MALVYKIQVDDKGNPAIVKLGRNAKKTDSKMKRLGTTIGNLSNRMKSMGSIVAGAAVFGAFTKFANAADVQRRALSRVGNAVKNVGIDFKDVEGEIRSVTAALQDKTNFGDEAQMGALARLIPMTGSYSDAMKELPTLLDFAAFAQVSLDTAVRQFGQAMQGNTETLGRQFVKLKDMKSAGASTAEIMDELRKRIQGAAEADVSPLEQIGNLLGDVAENIGEFLLPMLSMAFDALKALPAPVQTLIVLLPVLGAAFIAMGGPVTAVIAGIALVGVGIGKLVGNLKEGQEEIKAIQKSLDDAALAAEGFADSTSGLNIVVEGDPSTLTGKELAAYKAFISKKKVLSKEEIAENAAKLAKLYADRIVNRDLSTELMEEGIAKEQKINDNWLADKIVKLKGNYRGIEIAKDIHEKNKAEIDQTYRDMASDKLQEQTDKEAEILANSIVALRDLKIELMEGGIEQEKALNDAWLEDRLTDLKGNINATEVALDIHAKNKLAIEKKYNDNAAHLAKTRAINEVNAIGMIIGSIGNLSAALGASAKEMQAIRSFETVVNTSAAIMKALAQGGLFAIPMSIAIGINGAAQLAKINSASFASGGPVTGPGNSTSDSVPANLSRGEHVVSVADVASLGGHQRIQDAIDSSSGLGGGGGGTFVNNGVILGEEEYIRDRVIPMISEEMSR